ncbi:MAG: hypothetical protein JNL14_13295 [Devosia sp.]|uniref:hypothetical protein n=1 Tax=Devosia sp. TaxID=1871048 RepID=UPI001A367DE8|nr:hypothetical protein [Devosia sp.]MBL8598704.1 hypothetical protein [Devosia sp.]
MEPTYQPRLWHLIVTLFVVVFGGAVLWMIFNPRVADDYRNYYIDRSWSCFPREISYFYPLGEPVTFVAGRPGYERDTIRWCGFMPIKNDGIKSFGDYGILKLKFPIPDEDLLLTFSSWANTNASKPERQVTVSVNGQSVGILTFKDAKRVNGSFVIPAEIAKASPDGVMEVRWDVPRIAPPGTNSEPVTLQVRLEAVRIVPVSKAPPPVTTPVGEPAPARDNARWNEKGGVTPAFSPN